MPTPKNRSTSPVVGTYVNRASRSLKPASKKVLAAVEVKGEDYRVQWFALGAICIFVAFSVGIMTGWFMRG